MGGVIDVSARINGGRQAAGEENAALPPTSIIGNWRKSKHEASGHHRRINAVHHRVEQTTSGGCKR